MVVVDAFKHASAVQVHEALTESLREVSARLTSDEWQRVCLDAVICLSGAEAGIMFDACGVESASVRLNAEDVAELAVVAFTHEMPDSTLVQVHLPGGQRNAVRLPLRARGRTMGLIVLASDCDDPYGPDVKAVTPMLSAIAHLMAGQLSNRRRVGAVGTTLLGA